MLPWISPPPSVRHWPTDTPDTSKIDWPSPLKWKRTWTLRWPRALVSGTSTCPNGSPSPWYTRVQVAPPSVVTDTSASEPAGSKDSALNRRSALLRSVRSNGGEIRAVLRLAAGAVGVGDGEARVADEVPHPVELPAECGGVLVGDGPTVLRIRGPALEVGLCGVRESGRGALLEVRGCGDVVLYVARTDPDRGVGRPVSGIDRREVHRVVGLFGQVDRVGAGLRVGVHRPVRVAVDGDLGVERPAVPGPVGHLACHLVVRCLRQRHVCGGGVVCGHGDAATGAGPVAEERRRHVVGAGWDGDAVGACAVRLGVGQELVGLVRQRDGRPCERRAGRPLLAVRPSRRPRSTSARTSSTKPVVHICSTRWWIRRSRVSRSMSTPIWTACS